MNEKQQFQNQGMQWLYEMEILNHPHLINNLKMNIMMSSTRISEVELLMSRPHKSIMILLDVNLGWIKKESRFTEIEADVLDIMEKLLPSYRFRVIKDKAIMELAITKLETSLKGVKDEVSNTDDDDTDVSSCKNGVQNASDLLPDKEEPSENKQEKSDETVESDIQLGDKTQDPS